MAIERKRHIIGLYGNSRKEPKCILIVVVLGISLRDGIECLGDLFIGGRLNVVDIVGTKDDVIAEPVFVCGLRL